MPLLSICIPAFNKPEATDDLLKSIFSQRISDIEVIICEDSSPERKEIGKVANKYKEKYGEKINYIENEINLGYDKNLRKTIENATGDYVLLMGNDDLVAPNSFEIIKEKIDKYQPALIIRSYESFYKEFDNYFQVHKYVDKDFLATYSPSEMAWLFFRSVLVSGLVIKRDLAQQETTEIVDGTLYYQNYIIGRIFYENDVLYVPDILVYNRLEDAGYFGSSSTEKEGEWIPGTRTIDSSVYQMVKFFECAEKLQDSIESIFLDHLKKIASIYSYPVLAYHADKDRADFIRYMSLLRKIGYGGFFFNLYGLSIMILGKSISDTIIQKLKRLFGHTIRLTQ